MAFKTGVAAHGFYIADVSEHKKGTEVMGAEFVLDEFHIQKYIRRMALKRMGVML